MKTKFNYPEIIYNYLSDHKGEWISGNAMARALKLSSSYPTRYRERVLKEYNDILWDPKKGWCCVEKDEDTVAREILTAITGVEDMNKASKELIFGNESRYGDNKNEEGYNDPTAYFAFEQNGKGHGGEIWDIEKADHSMVPVLIINGTKSVCQVVYLYSSEILGVPDCKSFKCGSRTWYYEPVSLTTRKQRYLYKKRGMLEINEFNKVRGSIMDILGMPDRVIEIPVEVEKIVEKIVKKPVEVEKIVEVEKVVEKPMDIPKELLNDPNELEELREDVKYWTELYCDSISNVAELSREKTVLETQLDIYKKMYNDLMDRIFVKGEEVIEDAEQGA